MAFSSGIGTCIRNLVPRMAAARPEWRFTLLGAAGAEARAWVSAPNVRWVRCDAPIYGAREQVEIPLVAPRDASLFWSPHYNAPLLHPAPLVVTVHDVFHLAMPQYAGGALRRAYARGMFAGVRRRAAAIICASAFTRDELTRLSGPARRPPQVVHNGVDAEWFTPPEEGPPLALPYLLYVGNVKPHKNLVALLEAFATVKGRIPHHLAIVGKDGGFRTADARVGAAAAALGDRVRLTGEVGQRELRRWVAGATALVFPSLYEGFGLPPLEAMAAGCPAIVSRAGALPEVCGDAALYCDGRDPRDIAARILELVEDAALREMHVARGREHARGFTWDRSAARTLEIMQQAMRDGR